MDPFSKKVNLTRPPKYRSQRYILAYIIFGGMMNVFYQRINFSIAVICMVNHTAIRSLNGVVNNNQSLVTSLVTSSPYMVNDSESYMVPSFLSINNSRSRMVNNDGAGAIQHEGQTDDECDSQSSEKNEEKEDGPLVWDKTTQGLLLGAVYWTYVIMSIPSNLVIQRYSKKKILFLSMSVMTLMTFLMHGTALLSPWLVFLIKLVQGACTALAVLSMYGMWSKWAPPQEMAGLMSLSFSGTTFANASVFPLSALLCKYGFFGGWPSVFYVFGLISLVWIILLCLLTEESPSDHPRITTEELNYITSSVSSKSNTPKPKVPWWSIVKSPCVWAIILAQTSFTWGLFLFLSTLPLYFHEILKLNIKSNGLFSMLPYVAFFISCQVAGQISDFLIQHRFISILWMRKLCNIIANILPAVLLVIISFLDCTQTALAIGLLTVAVGATGFAFSCILVNPYDIAPRFAGSVVSISNMIATIPGFVTPYFVTSVTRDNTRSQWQIVFFTTSIILVIGTVGFCTMGKSHVQSWAQERDLFIVVENNYENDGIGCQKSTEDSNLEEKS